MVIDFAFSECYYNDNRIAFSDLANIAFSDRSYKRKNENRVQQRVSSIAVSDEFISKDRIAGSDL